MGLLDEAPEQEEGYAPMMGAGMEMPSQDFFKFRVEGMDILNELEHQLRGEVYDTNEGKYVKKFQNRITDEGVSDILNIIYSFGINKNTILGNLTHDEIYERCNAIWLELAKYFFLRGHRIGITRQNRGILLKQIVFMIHSALSRSEMGNEARQLSTSHQHIEHYMKQDKGKTGFNPLQILQRK